MLLQLWWLPSCPPPLPPTIGDPGECTTMWLTYIMICLLNKNKRVMNLFYSFFLFLYFDKNYVNQSVAVIPKSWVFMRCKQCFYFFMIINFPFFCNALIFNWGFHINKWIQGNTKTYMQDIYNINALFSVFILIL